MTNPFLALAEGKAPAWIVAVLLGFVLVGQTGVERIMDHFFPPAVEKAAADLKAAEHKMGPKLDQILFLQKAASRKLQSLELAYHDIDKRVQDNEAWIGFRKLQMRRDDDAESSR